MRWRLEDFLATQAERRPESTATVFRGAHTTYAVLEQESNRLARALRSAGCAEGDRVALLLTKSSRAIVAMFACLKANCIYIPLDTTAPVAHIRRILEKCECHFILAEKSTASLLNELTVTGALTDSVSIGWVDEGCQVEQGARVAFTWSDVDSLPAASIQSGGKPDDPAHILFTSGSTGLPKGVTITHANVSHFVRWAVSHFGMRAEDRISGHPPLHFDLSTFDIYGTIAVGAQIYLLPPETSLLPHKLAAFMRENELTQWFSVPWVLHQMAKFDAVEQNDFPALKRLLWCGEKFPTPALIHWMTRLPHVAFHNLYGPTEATIASSHYCVARCPENSTADVPIGLPCGGELLLVLDDELRPVKIDEIGDLYIGGVGLSPGYWNEPERSMEVFRRNPYSSNPRDRIYKTGDLAKIGADGLVYLAGRSDTQIKSRGYRIELAGIEAAVHALPDVHEAAVVAVSVDDSQDVAICCAYAQRPGAELTPIALRKQLTKSLPRYMIPQRWMALRSLPRTSNGKADRSLLKQQFQQPAGAERLNDRAGSTRNNQGNEPLCMTL